MPRLLLFGPARQLAGTGAIVLAGTTTEDVLAAAIHRFGPAFAELAGRSQMWVNGEPAEPGSPVAEHDELALLPPVSGG